MSASRAAMRHDAGLYTVSEISEAWGIPKSTIYAAIQRGELEAHAPGNLARPLFVTLSNFKNWMGGGRSDRS